MSRAGKLLIVDDETSVTNLLSDFFSGKDYEVEVALNAGDALMLASLNRPDAVILDLRLDDASGAEVLARLRAMDPGLGAVVLGGSEDESTARALLRAGAVDYVRKPFELERVERAVAVAVSIGRQHAPPSTVVPFRAVRRPEIEDSPRCERCREPLQDMTRVVVERKQAFHAPCWLQARRAGPAALTTSG